MKIKKFLIDIYCWGVTFIEVNSLKEFEKSVKYLEEYGVEYYEINDLRKYIKEGISGGKCWKKVNIRESLLLVYNATNGELRNDIICHEKRHLENNIMELCDISDNEAEAYLAGYLGRMLL